MNREEVDFPNFDIGRRGEWRSHSSEGGGKHLRMRTGPRDHFYRFFMESETIPCGRWWIKSRLASRAFDRKVYAPETLDLGSSSIL